MTGLIIGIVILGLPLFVIYKIGKLVGTEDLKIERIWCVPE